MRHAIILSGTGRHADEYHPFAETSRALAAVAVEAGLDPEIVTDVNGALAALRTAAVPDLAIANLAGPSEPDPARGDASLAGLERVLAEAPVLAMHIAAGAFGTSPSWECAIGGRWTETSWHPELGRTRVRRTEEATAEPMLDCDAFEVVDERYLGLRLADDNRVLFTHADEDGGRAPTIWVRERPCAPRAAYDALGHDARCYESEGHRAVLAALMRWLVAPRD
ncbi:ThuA domain-containing protein [Brachybacterium huguangmaarense]